MNVFGTIKYDIIF
jgi:metabotropic glutamate receptor 3